MIIEIYDENGEYSRSVAGDDVQCLGNVHENETWKEVSELRRRPVIYDMAKYLNGIKADKVAQIIVTTATGKVFDGDEKSQERILRAINIANITGDTTTQWKLADNTVVDVTREELKEALALAGKEMSKIWIGE